MYVYYIINQKRHQMLFSFFIPQYTKQIGLSMIHRSPFGYFYVVSESHTCWQDVGGC